MLYPRSSWQFWGHFSWREKEDVISCPSIMFWLYTRLQYRSSKSLNFLVFITSGGISSSLAAFRFLIFVSITLSPSLMSSWLLIIFVIGLSVTLGDFPSRFLKCFFHVYSAFNRNYHFTSEQLGVMTMKEWLHTVQRWSPTKRCSLVLYSGHLFLGGIMGGVLTPQQGIQLMYSKSHKQDG